MAVAGATGDDQGLGLNHFAIDSQREWSFRQIHRFERAELHARAEALGLFLHPGHQLIAVNAFGKTGIVFDDTRGCEQASWQCSREHQRR